MATEEYWEKTRGHLFHPQLGGVVRYAPMQEEALVKNGPWMANVDVVELLVLGYQAEASAILEYVPRLEALVRAKPGAYDLSALSFGIWLRSDAFDREIATRAFSSKRDYAIKEKQMEGPTLTSIFLLALECDDDDAAWQLYQTYHKSPLDEVPNNKRKLAGPQHLLGLTARIGKDPTGKEQLLAALKVFAARARHWDKRHDPVPYVSMVILTRILVQCLRRLDEPPRREDLWALIR
jgi:hypothetical protein